MYRAFAEFPEPLFTASALGRAFCYVFFAVNLYSLIFIVQSTLDAIAKYDSCFDEFCSINVCRTICAHFMIVWINYVANFSSSLTLLLYRRERTRKCLNGVARLLSKRLSVSTIQPIAWMVVFFMMLQISVFVINWSKAGFETEFIYDYLALYVAQCLPLVTENLICVMLLITQNCYDDVNQHVKRLIDRPYYAEDVRGTLQTLKHNHWAACDVSDDISNCFGIDFFVVAFCTTLRYIYFLFLNMKYITRQNRVLREGGGLVLPGYDTIMFSMTVVGKFYYLCYRCDNVVAKVRMYSSWFNFQLVWLYSEVRFIIIIFSTDIMN